MLRVGDSNVLALTVVASAHKMCQPAEKPTLDTVAGWSRTAFRLLREGRYTSQCEAEPDVHCRSGETVAASLPFIYKEAV